MKGLLNNNLWPENCAFLKMGNKKILTNKVLIAAVFFTGCADDAKQSAQEPRQETVRATTSAREDSVPKKTTPVLLPPGKVETMTTNPAEILDFARTLIGTPYLYASTDPEQGFDCSGFITYVFNHFNISVPRSSVDFTNYGTEIPVGQAKPGDLILFTGTDSTIRIVGHMGIVESLNDDKLCFIHSTSGKAKGVVITPMEKYYKSRFVKVIRVFPEELFE